MQAKLIKINKSDKLHANGLEVHVHCAFLRKFSRPSSIESSQAVPSPELFASVTQTKTNTNDVNMIFCGKSI